MKIILILLILIALPVCYFLYTGEQGAVWSYEHFAGQLYKMKFDAAKNAILPSAASDFEQARSFYQRAYGKLREGFLYPKYQIIQKEKSGSNGFSFKLEQTVPADMPGSTSAFGTALLTFTHEAEMEFQGWQWKVKRFRIYSKSSSSVSSSGHLQSRKEESKPFDLLAYFKTFFEKTQTKLTTPAKLVPVSKHNKIPPEDLKTFHLKDGQTVSGKIILDDPVYYTLENEDGKQVIVIKEDIA